MCGINAIISKNAPILSSSIKKMNLTLNHRGPDSSGIWLSRDRCIAFGHTRLSILGLGPCGSQPMLSHDKEWIIVYNGEIYNHLELRKELPIKHWRGSSDTETLINAISVLGVYNCLTRIQGMFAFIAFHTKRKRIYMARDPFGEKPISFFKSNEKIVVSSELSAIRQGIDKLIIEKKYISDYLQFGFPTKDYSVFKGVKTLNPGEICEIDIKTLQLKASKIKKEIPSQTIHNLSTAIDSLDTILKKTISSVCLSEVPLGILLSGGIDSSLIAAYTKKANIKNLTALSLGFSEKTFSEVESACEISKSLNIDILHKTISPREISHFLLEAIKKFDTPLADPSVIPTMCLAQFAAQHVKVVLGGDGADELFGGYNRHVYFNLMKNIPLLRNKTVISALKLSERLPQKITGPYFKNLFNKIGKVSDPTLLRYYHDIMKNSEYANDSKTNDPFFSCDTMDNLLQNDLKYYLPNNILRKTDRSFMSFSVEPRLPFLHPDVFSIRQQISSGLFVKNFQNKYILRKLLQNKFPFLSVKKRKIGFGPPISHWLKTVLREWVFDSFQDEISSGYSFVPKKTLQSMLSEHFKNQHDHGNFIFSYFFLTNWLKRNI